MTYISRPFTHDWYASRSGSLPAVKRNLGRKNALAVVGSRCQSLAINPRDSSQRFRLGNEGSTSLLHSARCHLAFICHKSKTTWGVSLFFGDLRKNVFLFKIIFVISHKKCFIGSLWGLYGCQVWSQFIFTFESLMLQDFLESLRVSQEIMKIPYVSNKKFHCCRYSWLNNHRTPQISQLFKCLFAAANRP